MSLINLIKTSFWGELFVSYLHCAECIIIPRLISDERAVRRSYKKHTGKELDLLNPRSFTEKLQWYKLNSRDILMQKCADKIDVREYVASKGYKDTLNGLLGVYKNSKDIDFESLPNQFVIKGAHGSHMNIIVNDKNKLNICRTKMLLNSWLRQYWGWAGREWVYKNLQRRIVVENYLEDETGELRDYKFFCFNGVPKFIQVDIGRFREKHIRNFYDLDWNLMPFSAKVGCGDASLIGRPIVFDQMVKMAKDLSEPFQFVRVDLYEVKGKIYFGELTFYHGGGIPNIKPIEWDYKIGDFWTLETPKDNKL